jgi:hypothetical protein
MVMLGIAVIPAGACEGGEKKAQLVFMPASPIKYKKQETLVEAVLNAEAVNTLVEGVSVNTEAWFKKG